MPVPSFEDPPRCIDESLPDLHGPAKGRSPEKTLLTGAGAWPSCDAACEVRHGGNVRTDRLPLPIEHSTGVVDGVSPWI
jgi:hypothetical protein